jgi:hypothetical protein
MQNLIKNTKHNLISSVKKESTTEWIVTYSTTGIKLSEPKLNKIKVLHLQQNIQ